MSRADDVLVLLRDVALPLDDDDIGGRLGINRHYVNAICRRLSEQGLATRYVGSNGKLVTSVGAASGDRESGPAPAPVTGGRRRQPRAQRARTNVDSLVATFAECVDRFEQSNAFPGPSLYFHEQAIRRRRACSSAEEAVENDRLVELIYAVLPAWGMHRMGRQAAKVGAFEPFRDSIRSQRERLQDLWSFDIRTIAPGDADEVAREVWEIISSLNVSTSRTTIVAGSKTLHHLLPDLVPPIDRQYTFKFFTGQTAVSHGERAAFAEWFPFLCEIGRTCDAAIDDALRRGGFMATSASKVIDNAIMGFRQGQPA